MRGKDEGVEVGGRQVSAAHDVGAQQIHPGLPHRCCLVLQRAKSRALSPPCMHAEGHSGIMSVW